MTRKRAPAHVLRAYLTMAVVAAIPAALASAADTPAPPTTLANLIVAKDLPVQLAKFRQVHMAFDAQALSSRERQLVEKLVEASRYLGEVYWEQSDPGALVIYRDLKSDHSPAAEQLRRFLRINGSRYSLIQENRPFIGTTPMPPGRNLFPADLTRTEFDAFVAAHPT